MAEKTIHVIVTLNNREAVQAIPYDIDEVQLKALLRDLGFISSYRRSYYTTKVYLENEKKLMEICKDEYRTLEALGIKENRSIIIDPGEPEPRQMYNYYSDPGSMTCLYGCPMAQSVKEAMSQAEKYSDDDSVVTTGHIGIN